jgi:hypothetical protein
MILKPSHDTPHRTLTRGIIHTHETREAPQSARLLIFLAFFFFWPCMTARADHIFLTSGAIIKGTVVSQTPEKTQFKKTDGTVVSYDADKIMRILYTDLYMGQQYIRLTDGKVIQAYLVDEDRTTYTFRKDITSPREFTIPRQKILFMARKNPNELQGTADYTSIDLTWKAPMGTVRLYRIYVKKESESYGGTPTATTANLQYRVSGLASSTDYNAKVTAVDEKGQESLPSNEITLSTLNRSPLPPDMLRCVMVNERHDNSLSAMIEWSPAHDDDGSIREYQINLLEPGKKDFTRAAVIPEDPKAPKEKNLRH